ncbi:MAG: hypothetical protein KJ573_08295 [Proteobacteria bacterium]|nr:hypothetical protein [Pseudomonadota bacterium]MBU1903577.1 hypothetical protein [Pseudomonadota bacterium]
MNNPPVGLVTPDTDRVEQYKAECHFFQKKYGMSMEEFESRLHEEKGYEDFEKEDDLADWQFSLETLRWWEEKERNLQKSLEESL